MLTHIAIDNMNEAETCPSVRVVGCARSLTEALIAYPGRLYLELHYRKGTRPPFAGETVPTWRDGSTLYAVAPPSI